MIGNGSVRSLLLAGLVVLSVTPLASGGLATSTTYQPDSSTAAMAEEPEPADEIYVRENGSAVLVYEEDDSTDATEPPTDVEYGADIGSNLFYFLASEPLEGETGVTGEASVLLAETNVSGDGQFSVDRP